ncbi:MAG: sigma-70 family RNA polymerase sigma factor [Muribaculaceae bacterium]|nr:sigma-70 family RNA polymerase sigma factor [Muribaculaceae bacterium]
MTGSEELLLKRARAGDAGAQRAIYSSHVRYLTAVCSRYILDPEDVRDVLQESFLKIFSSLNSFEFKGEGSLKAWMSRIVVNMTMNFLRRNGKIKFADLDEADRTVMTDEPETDNLPADVIYRTIRELPEGYRAVFNLYVIEERSHREIAEMLNIKESTSASQLHRAKMMLASKLKEYQSVNELDSL